MKIKSDGYGPSLVDCVIYSFHQQPLFQTTNVLWMIVNPILLYYGNIVHLLFSTVGLVFCSISFIGFTIRACKQLEGKQ